MGGRVRAAGLLVRALREPGSTASLDAAGWQALVGVARAEQLVGTLAARLDPAAMPPTVCAVLRDATASAEQGRVAALWEAGMVRRALGPVGCPVVLLKGTAYLAAGLEAGRGRSVGDCDILVPRAALPEVEAALLSHGWEWAKPDPYDDGYYRRWMHELPPLIHRERDRMLDVHHTILPLTARARPDADALIADAVPLGNGLHVLSPADMVCHAAAHLFADGDLSGGLRNLWDIHCLLGEHGTEGGAERARRHGLLPFVHRAARLAHDLFGTEVPAAWLRRERADALYRRRLLARDGWGRGTRPATRAGFYVRSHWIRMPPGLLARHLWTKWRRD